VVYAFEVRTLPVIPINWAKVAGIFPSPVKGHFY
jgi:hypothetical protein